VLPIIGATVTAAARKTAHLITLIVDIFVIGALCVYVTYKARERPAYPTWFSRWGPTIFVWLAFPLILADPLRHVLADKNVWKPCHRRCGELWPAHCDWSSNEYHCALRCGILSGQECEAGSAGIQDCTCVHDHQENVYHLSVLGWVFTIGFTYIGFILFLFGSLWSGNICEKCRDARHLYRVQRGYSDDFDE
jgi:hypothetical protein